MVRETGSRRSRRRFLALAGSAGAGALAGCLDNIGGTASGGGTDVVNYGVLAPTTGPYASLAEGQKNGAELAVRHVNESDEFDFEMEAAYGDTQANSSTATSEAQRMVQQESASYLVGAISSSVALVLNEFAADNEVIYNPGASALPITGTECNEYVFRPATNTAQVAEAAAEWTVSNVGERVWFHLADYAYGNSVHEQWRSRMSGVDGFEEVGVTRAQLGSQNFDTYISQIANSDANVVVVGSTGGDLITFVNQAKQAGLHEEVDIVAPTMTFQVVRNALGEAADGTYGGVRYVATLDAGRNQSFAGAYADEYGGPPDAFAQDAYQGIWMTAHGIREAGSTDPADVKDALAGLEVETSLGPVSFRDCDHQALNPVWLGQNRVDDDGSVRVEILDKKSGEEATPACGDVGCSL